MKQSLSYDSDRTIQILRTVWYWWVTLWVVWSRELCSPSLALILAWSALSSPSLLLTRPLFSPWIPSFSVGNFSKHDIQYRDKMWECTNIYTIYYWFVFVFAVDFYSSVRRHWIARAEDLRNVTVLSVGGGYRDYQVRSGLTTLTCPVDDLNKMAVVVRKSYYMHHKTYIC